MTLQKDACVSISIITVSFNTAEYIEQTIVSVLSQTYLHLEYIIIDGKSSDSTLYIIKKHQSKISLLISEKDTGIFNAMNKGLKVMTGDLVLFLNSGDYLHDNNVISDVVNVFNKNPGIHLLYGNVVFDYGTRKQIRKYRQLDRIFFSCSTISQQVMFAKKALFVKYGFFDEEFRVVGDWNWVLNLFLRHKKEIITYYLDRIICVFDKKEGASTRPFSYPNETMTVLKRYYSNVQLIFYYPICLMRQRLRKMFFEERI